jgi:endoglucanase
MKSTGDVQEDDFRWIADWGFDFVRLPMCYTLWIEDNDIHKFHEPMLDKIDHAVELGKKHHIHVSLNFHRAQGYSVNPEHKEPFDLWKDQEALDAFCFHWELFARRYRGIPSNRLSFDLVNEPASPSPKGMTRKDHERVVRSAFAAIHAVDPSRQVIADGLTWGNDPCPELADLDLAQSCRAYAPMGISHYKASWVGGEKFPEPKWPGGWNYGTTWGRKELEKHYSKWTKLAAKGVGIHCGEGGAFNLTPHDVVLRWFRDVLEILTEHGIGYALWNFRGSFGVLDSGRKDAVYKNWHGHKLDTKLLALLREF